MKQDGAINSLTLSYAKVPELAHLPNGHCLLTNTNSQLDEMWMNYLTQFCYESAVEFCSGVN